jgi:arylsulfatase A-like enzyme
MRNLLFLFSFWILCSLNSYAQKNEDRPNILWIVSEDNTTMLGCYGDQYATTPQLDKFAKEGVLYKNAFSQPACAISRATLITGMHSSSLGIEEMRSNYPIPDYIKFFPDYLRKAGYYTTNNAKEDYNTSRRKNVWNESSGKATYKNRKPGQPFFAVFNLGVTHESSIGIHGSYENLEHDPEKVVIPPYLPATPEMKKDFALYYDKIEKMDKQVANLLKELDDAGLADNTIVFYYSDNGGVLGRSKRFLYDSGVHVPLIIRFPKKYASMAPSQPGSETDRIVSFDDFAPTVLSLAGVKAPKIMEGVPFLGKYQKAEKEYALGLRGRIDETIEMSRTIRDKQYRYIRNYMPHKIYGQHNEYYWNTKSIVSWDEAFKAGKLNALQSAFWFAKPTEELYDTMADPDNVTNLINDKNCKDVLEKMRNDFNKLMIKNNDAGFIPESMRVEISKNSTVYEYAKSSNYPLKRILETADYTINRNDGQLPELISRLNDDNPIVRYWAATGCTILGKKALKAKKELNELLNDSEAIVRIAAAEALYSLNKNTKGITALSNSLQSDNELERLEALTVLESMNQDAKSALPAIKSLIDLHNDKKNQEKESWRLPHDVKVAKRIVSNIQIN